jgi:hypothetical protein
MEPTKSTSLTDKVKAYAWGIAGSGIFCQGIFYFPQRPSYYVPRLLEPIFDKFGNIGFAISLLIVGILFIIYAYIQLKKTNANLNFFRLGMPIFILVFSAVYFLFNAFAKIGNMSSEELNKKMETDRQHNLEQINQMEKPDFKDAEIEAWIASFDPMYQTYAANKAAKNMDAIRQSEKEYGDWVLSEGKLLQNRQDLSIETKQQLSLYFAKLSMQWQAVK